MAFIKDYVLNVYTYVFIVYLYEYLYACTWFICVSGALRGQKQVSDTLELELRMVVGLHMMLGTEPGSAERTARALKSISSAPGKYVPPVHMVLKITGNLQLNTEIFAKGNFKDSWYDAIK